MDQNEVEERAELEAFVKANFHDIKKWYTSPIIPSTDISSSTTSLSLSELKNELKSLKATGTSDFPMFSREFLNWPLTHVKLVVRSYQKHLSAIERTKNENQAQSQTPPDDGTLPTEPDSELSNKQTRKRRRFGNKPADKGTEPSNGSEHGKSTNAEEQGGQNSGADTVTTVTVKRSRWAAPANGATGSTLASASSTAMTKAGTSELRSLQQQKTFLLRLKIDEINRKLMTVSEDAKLAEKNPERSPSPEPIYDANGKRINVREVRMKNKLESEKKGFMEELVKLNPALKPANMKMSLISRKLYVPVRDYPGYNFLGLIIGPRGLTQKRMETETNTKITIKGKGSVRPGRGKMEEESHDDLHILVEGEDEEDVEKAADMISKLLTPNHDCLEEHRQKQMQELALINGTQMNGLEDESCVNCGEKGHRLWECPHQVIASFTMANVICKICGETSHVTADCPLKNFANKSDQAELEQKIDKEYYEFMEMVGGEKAGPVKPVNNSASVNAPVVSNNPVTSALAAPTNIKTLKLSETFGGNLSSNNSIGIGPSGTINGPVVKPFIPGMLTQATTIFPVLTQQPVVYPQTVNNVNVNVNFQQAAAVPVQQLPVSVPKTVNLTNYAAAASYQLQQRQGDAAATGAYGYGYYPTYATNTTTSTNPYGYAPATTSNMQTYVIPNNYNLLNSNNNGQQ